MRNTKPTIADVAKHAGVSTATVSRVTNNSSVSENTRKRVLRSIEQLNYTVNSDGKALRSKKTNRILLSLANISNPFYTTLAENIESTLGKNGYHILLSASANTEEEIHEQIDKAASGFVDGFILGPINFSNKTIAKLKKLNLPTVVNGPLISGTKIDSIGTSEYHGMREAIFFLLAKGRKKFLLLNGPAESIPGRNRNFFFQKIMSEIELKSIKYEIRNATAFTFEQAYAEVFSMPTIGNFDAVICGNDLMAAAVINYLREINRTIPGDTSVLGIDNDDFCNFMYPKISSIDLCVPEMGELAANVLLQRLKDPKHKSIERLTKSRFVKREST